MRLLLVGALAALAGAIPTVYHRKPSDALEKRLEQQETTLDRALAHIEALKAEVDGVRALDNEREMHHHRRESSLMAGDTDADLERRAQKAHVYGDQVVASGTRGLYMDELNGRRCASQDGVEIECMVVTAHEGRLEIEGLVALYYARHGQSEWNEHYKWYDPWRQDAPRFADSPLTGSGINDAIELARAVATKADFYEELGRIAHLQLKIVDPGTGESVPWTEADVGPAALKEWAAWFMKAQAAAKVIFTEEDQPQRVDMHMTKAEATSLLTRTPIAASPLFRARDTAFIGFAVARVLLDAKHYLDHRAGGLVFGGPDPITLPPTFRPHLLYGWQETDPHNDCIVTLDYDDNTHIDTLRPGAGRGSSVQDVRGRRMTLYGDQDALREFADFCARELVAVRHGCPNSNIDAADIHQQNSNHLDGPKPAGNPHISSGTSSYKMVTFAEIVLAQRRLWGKAASTVAELTGLDNAKKIIKKPITYTRPHFANTRYTDLFTGMKDLYDVASRSSDKQVAIGAHSRIIRDAVASFAAHTVPDQHNQREKIEDALEDFLLLRFCTGRPGQAVWWDALCGGGEQPVERATGEQLVGAGYDHGENYVKGLYALKGKKMQNGALIGAYIAKGTLTVGEEKTEVYYLLNRQGLCVDEDGMIPLNHPGRCEGPSVPIFKGYE